MALLFVLGIPLNVRGAVRDVDKAEPDVTAYRDKILTTARLPIARELPASLPPESELAVDLPDHGIAGRRRRIWTGP